MDHTQPLPRTRLAALPLPASLGALLPRAWPVLLALLAALWAPLQARAEDDPPGRVGRVAESQGEVVWFDPDQGRWEPVVRNRPVTTGDRLSTERDARLELRIGSVTVRLGENTELEVLRLDDERISLQLHSGSLALRVRSRDVAQEVDVVTAETRLRPLRSGHYRVDRVDDSTYAGSWRGEWRVDDGPQGFTIGSGQREEIWRESGDRLRHQDSRLPNDAFAGWAQRDDQNDERSASQRYVSPEMTGAEELDRHGRWDQHPEYGAVWFPRVVVDGWAPYRHGRWTWVRPWGWTWVDEAPWGFAPFHYGRWVSWRGRWCWVPGTYVRRPVYAPALVAWVGALGVSVSINIGGGPVGWVPLAPREAYIPYYRHSPRYIDRVNLPPRGGWVHPPRPVHPGPISGPGPQVVYSNQGVPGAVTVVPHDVLMRREPVARAVVQPGPTWTSHLPTRPVAAPPAPPVAAAQGDDGRAGSQAPGTRMRIQPVRPPVQTAPVMAPVMGGRAEPSLANEGRPSAPRQPAAPTHPAVQPGAQPVPVHRGSPVVVESQPATGPAPAVVDLRTAPREQAQREQQQREQAQREQQQREQQQRDQAQREGQQREQAQREQAQREQSQREQAARERAQREQREGGREQRTERPVVSAPQPAPAAVQPAPRMRVPEREERREERKEDRKEERKPGEGRNPNPQRESAR